MPLYIYAINGTFAQSSLSLLAAFPRASETQRALDRKAAGAQAPGEGPGLGNTSGTRHLTEHNMQGSRSGEPRWASISYWLVMH